MTDMDCTNCTQKGNVFTTTVPLVVLENQRAHDAVTNRRLVNVIVLLIILLFASNAFWAWRDSEFEDIYVDQQNDSGINNYIGNDGDIYNGKADDYLP